MTSHRNMQNVTVRRHPFTSPISRRLVAQLDAELQSIYPDWDQLNHPYVHGTLQPEGSDEQPTLGKFENPLPKAEADQREIIFFVAFARKHYNIQTNGIPSSTAEAQGTMTTTPVSEIRGRRRSSAADMTTLVNNRAIIVTSDAELDTGSVAGPEILRPHPNRRRSTLNSVFEEDQGSTPASGIAAGSRRRSSAAEMTTMLRDKEIIVTNDSELDTGSIAGPEILRFDPKRRRRSTLTSVSEGKSEDHTQNASLIVEQQDQQQVQQQQEADEEGEEAIGCVALRLFLPTIITNDANSSSNSSNPVPGLLPNITYAEVKRMFTVPSHRGQGLSHKLINTLKSHAQSLGVQCLVLETGLRQQAAVTTYFKNGFTKKKDTGDGLRGMYGEWIDADPTGGGDSICMEKWL